MLSVCISSLLLLPMLLLSRIAPEQLQSTIFYVPHVDVRAHLFIFIKSLIVLSSWVFAYMAMKHLPITIVTPVNATRPMWTLLGALVIFGEHLNGWQWSGVVVCLISFYAFSLVGRKEGVSFVSNRWIWCLIAATLLGASSGLYDKYLMRQFDHNAVQVYYTFYQAVMMLIVWFVVNQKSKIKNLKSIKNIWAIVLISLFLIVSDNVYMLALRDPDSLIAVVSTIRRGGAVIGFAYGLIFLKENDPWRKVVSMIGILAGLICLAIGSIA